MPEAAALPSRLAARPGGIAVVLFSQADCEFCAEMREHYLRPLLAEHRAGVAVAESRVDADLPIRDWNGRQTTQRLFAAAQGVRFAPTVMFFDSSGRSLAEPIVGLSRDYFGIYLEQRIATALAAASRA
ncbi:MAG: thioredoxin fold domain-containing protein [Caldimonas sp.]